MDNRSKLINPFIIVRPPSGVNGVRQNFPPVCGFEKQAHGTACRILLQPSPSHSAALLHLSGLANLTISKEKRIIAKKSQRSVGTDAS